MIDTRQDRIIVSRPLLYRRLSSSIMLYKTFQEKAFISVTSNDYISIDVV